MVIVKVMKAISEKNDQVAAAIRYELTSRHIAALNIISSPGSGKTALLEETLRRLPEGIRCAVIVGDPFGTSDAERIEAVGGTALQLNTEGSCHLTAPMIRVALSELDIENLHLIFIENIGNLICPASWDLGESARVTLLSVTEGEDKIIKYRNAFFAADAIVFSKLDLADRCDFNIVEATSAIRSLNPRSDIHKLSSKTGEGMQEWVVWLQKLASF